MGSNSSSQSEKFYKEEIKENSRIFNCNTVLGVEINHLEEFMDSIFEEEEIPREFAESMKKK